LKNDKPQLNTEMLKVKVIHTAGYNDTIWLLPCLWTEQHWWTSRPTTI